MAYFWIGLIVLALNLLYKLYLKPRKELPTMRSSFESKGTKSSKNRINLTQLHSMMRCLTIVKSMATPSILIKNKMRIKILIINMFSRLSIVFMNADMLKEIISP